MFDVALPNPANWVNTRLLGEPLNWLIVGVIASVWLICFHAIMTGFASMQAGQATQQDFGTGPGQVVAQSPSASAFSLPGALASGQTTVPGLFMGGATPVWSDGAESKYAEDGWIANP